MDTLTKNERSERMSRIKSKDSKEELFVRKLLFSLGFRYRLHYKKLPGKPDIVFPSRRKVILINGCFWHGHNCKTYKQSKSNKAFWDNKIAANKRRDKKNKTKLTKAGWQYIVIWSCQIKKSKEESLKLKLLDYLG